MTKALALAAAAVLALVFAGCVKRQALEPAWVVPADCEFLPAPPDVPDTVTVAVFDDVGPELAPVPHNAAQGLAYGHLYQTLTVLDCTGEVRGALASSWEKHDGGRRWTFELGQDLEFWDGRPVTAWDVEWWWETTMRDSPWFTTTIDSIAADGERSVFLYFNRKYDEAPRLLASPRFAVAAPSYESRWPVGSGAFEVTAVPGTPTSSTLVIRPAFGRSGPVIRFVSAAAGEARDLLDETADAMVTDDPEVIDYARTRQRFSVAAMPWDETYVFLSTSRLQEIRDGGDPPRVSADVCAGLAADAVRVEARGHAGPAWWEDIGDCGVSIVPWNLSSPLLEFPRDAARSGATRIVYEAGDPVARDLAERLVALAAGESAASIFAPVRSGSGEVTVVAAGLDRRELSRSLRFGNDFAYVVALPLRVADPCVAVQQLLSGAPWLGTAGASFAGALVGLVDTRPTLIADPDKTGAAIDGYGGVLLYGWTLEGNDLP